MESNSTYWQCSKGNCIFQQPGEVLVVVRISRGSNILTFTWLRVFYHKQPLATNEYLFWAIWDNGNFILLDEYKCEGVPPVVRRGHIDKKLLTSINKKRGQVDTFKRNIDSLWKKISEMKKGRQV